MMGRVSSMLGEVLSGYRRIGSMLGRAVLFLVSVVAVSAVIVWPLWYLATHARGAYTIVSAVAVFGLLAYWAVRTIRLRRAVRRDRRRRVARRWPRRLLGGAAVLITLYAAFALGAAGYLWIAIPAAAIGVLLVGYLGAGTQ
jgi:hypothetical protein